MTQVFCDVQKLIYSPLAVLLASPLFPQCAVCSFVCDIVQHVSR